MLPIGLKEFEEVPAVLKVNQPQLRLFVNSVAKLVFRQGHGATQIRPPMEGRFVHLLSGDIMVPHLFCDRASCCHISIIGWNWRDFRKIRNAPTISKSSARLSAYITVGTNYAKYKILVQLGTPMFAQANQNSQSMRKLLQ
jgi:hypothetical protein